MGQASLFGDLDEPSGPGAYGKRPSTSTAPYSNETTSKAAARQIVGVLNELQAACFRYIHERGRDGATCDEVELGTGLSHQTASARCRELSGMGRIVDSGETRTTRSGRRAIAWLAAEFAEDKP